MSKGANTSSEILTTSGPGLLRTLHRLRQLDAQSDNDGPDFDGEYSAGTEFTRAETIHLDAVVRLMDKERADQEKKARSISIRFGNWLNRIGRRLHWR